MPPENEKSPSLEALRKLIEQADTERVVKKDFENLARQIIELVKADKAINAEKRSELLSQVQSALSDFKSQMDAHMKQMNTSMQSVMESQINKLQFDHEAMMAELQAKADSLVDGEDGIDGKDADHKAIVADVLAQIKLPENQVIDVEKLKQEIISSLPRPQMRGSIGASVVHKFIDDETPSGTINASNTVFYLAKAPINGSLKLYLGGARQRVGEDFTLVNKTITFTIAPDTGSVLLADYRHW